MNETRDNSAEQSDRLKRRHLMRYTMLLIAGDRRQRGIIIRAGLQAGFDRERIDADSRRYRIASHA